MSENSIAHSSVAEASRPSPLRAEGTEEARAPLFTWDFATLMAAQASFGYAFSSFFLLPKFLVSELAAGPVEIGLAMAAYGLSALVFIPAMGAVVDRFGRRDFLTTGAITMAAASIGFVAVDSVGPLLYALRALQGLAFAMAFVAGVTIAVDQAPTERLGQAIGLIGLAMLSMNAIAPAALELMAEQVGWSLGFATAAGAALLCGVLSRFVRDDSAPTRASVDADTIPTLWQIASEPSQVRIAVVVALAGSAFGAMITFHQPFALELGMVHVRSFFVAYAGAAITVRLGLGWVVDLAGRRRVSVAALALYASVVSSMAWLQAGTLPAFGLAFGVAHGLFYPALNAVAVEGRGPHERGKVMALFQAAFSIGFAGAAFPLGLLAERAGYPAVFLAAGLSAFAGLAVLATSPDGRSPRQRR